MSLKLEVEAFKKLESDPHPLLLQQQAVTASTPSFRNRSVPTPLIKVTCYPHDAAGWCLEITKDSVNVHMRYKIMLACLI